MKKTISPKQFRKLKTDKAGRVRSDRYVLEPVVSIARAYDLPPYVTEYRFHKIRKWRFDLAWPEHKIAVEYEGIVEKFSRGNKSGHLTVKGYTKDCEKYNTAQLDGWIVLRFTALTPESHLRDWLVNAFEEGGGRDAEK